MSKCLIIQNGTPVEGNATPSDVLSGKTFMSANSDDVQIGTLSLSMEIIAQGNAKTSGSQAIVTTTKDYDLIIMCATNSDTNNKPNGGSFTCDGGTSLHNSSIKNYTGDANGNGQAFMTIGIYKDVPSGSICTLNIGAWGRVWKVFGFNL